MQRLTAHSRLALIRVKIERAKKHLSDLETQLVVFRDKHMQVTLRKNNSDTGQSEDEIAKLPVRPFSALSAAGDVIHNLRSALDHLANQLVWVGSAEEPSRLVEFPIAQDAATYERGKARKVEGMSPKAIKAIDALNPYKGGNDALWRIHELDNIDKHRSLFTFSHDCLLVDDWMNTFFPFLYKAGDNPPFGVFDSQVEQDVQLEIDEALGNPKITQGNALVPTLHQLVDFVDNLVTTFLPYLE